MKKLLLNTILAFALILISHGISSAQGTYNICSVTSTTDSTGTLYDTGGPTGGYQVNEDCTLLIAPPCGISITLTFSAFDTESNFDYFTAYDGSTTAGTQLMHTSGSTLPTPITATTGSMLIIWHSDVSITFTGFACSWTSVIASSAPPIAAFSASTVTPPLSWPVQFTDQSTGGAPTAWLWNFGGGPSDTSRRQNPRHTYNTPGPYTVTLIAYSCTSSDTTTQIVNVQNAPYMAVSPDSLVANANCGDTVSFTLAVSDTLGGELAYSLSGSSNQQVRVLVMSYGSDQFTEYPHTLQALNQYFTNYALTQTATTDPGVLQGLLVGKNVLLIPEQETGVPSVWATLGPVIRAFLNNGGSVVWMGSFSSFSDCMFDLNVWTGTFVHDAVFNTCTVVDPTHPLVQGVPASFTAPSATWKMDLTNSDKVQLIKDATDNKDILAYRYYGPGKAIFIAFDYYNIVNESARILGNAIQWGGQNSLASWIHLSDDSGSVTAVNTHNIHVTFQTTGLPAGTYYSNIAVSGNDPNNPLVIVPCTLTVSGNPIIAMSDSCVAFGNVMQYTNQTKTFNIINNGCDTLFVDSVNSNSNDFIVTSGITYLLPGAYAPVTVSFGSATVGTFSGSIHIVNNAKDTTVCLSATTFPAPQIAVNPSSGVTTTLPACGASDSLTFWVNNNGGSDLTYAVGGTPAWLSASPGNDTITAGDSAMVTLHFNSGVLVGGSYHTNLSIISNDPLTPTQSVPCTLNVGQNPCVSFSDSGNACTGISCFTSSSINTPTSYDWNFGDNTPHDTTANPCHPFARSQAYAVTLIACNGAGCDTVTDTVHAVVTGPRAISCYPATLSYCCGIGVTNLQISPNGGAPLLNNTTNDAIDGYQDYSCIANATLLTNSMYRIEVTTGLTYVETVKAWLDFNNDGVLSANELIFGDSAVLTHHSGFFYTPDSAGIALNTPLRLRVASDYSSNPTPAPCLDLQYGQVEDYSITLTYYDKVNEIPDAVAFSAYPNPYNRNTTIEYSLNTPSKVSLEIFNLLGAKIQGYCLNEMQASGKHIYSFEGAGPGIYFVKLTVDGKSSVQKVVKM